MNNDIMQYKKLLRQLVTQCNDYEWIRLAFIFLSRLMDKKLAWRDGAYVLVDEKGSDAHE